MLCLINKRKSLQVNSALKKLVIKFVVLLRIIFIFYCFRLTNSNRGCLCFPLRTVHYIICFLNTCLRNMKNPVIIFLFPIRKYKEKQKKTKFWEFLKVSGEKKVRKLIKFKSCGKKKLRTVKN